MSYKSYNVGLTVIIIIAAIFFISGFSTVPQTPTSEAEKKAETEVKIKYIGTAWMEKDRTIFMDLRAETDEGTIGHARLKYPPDHTEYSNIIKHLGGLSPGETKLVPPWPEE